ncbi:hypothetical protein GC174_02720 [bacterium]|nr:hypothetical protein [bacterium]
MSDSILPSESENNNLVVRNAEKDRGFFERSGTLEAFGKPGQGVSDRSGLAKDGTADSKASRDGSGVGDKPTGIKDSAPADHARAAEIQRNEYRSPAEVARDLREQGKTPGIGPTGETRPNAVQPGAADRGVPVEQPKAATAVLNRDGSPDGKPVAPVKEGQPGGQVENPTSPVKADIYRAAADASVRPDGKLSPDAGARLDTAVRSDVAARPDVSGRSDANVGPSVGPSVGPNAISKPDAAVRPDPAAMADLAGKQDTGYKADLQPRDARVVPQSEGAKLVGDAKPGNPVMLQGSAIQSNEQRVDIAQKVPVDNASGHSPFGDVAAKSPLQARVAELHGKGGEVQPGMPGELSGAISARDRQITGVVEPGSNLPHNETSRQGVAPGASKGGSADVGAGHDVKGGNRALVEPLGETRTAQDKSFGAGRMDGAHGESPVKGGHTLTGEVQDATGKVRSGELIDHVSGGDRVHGGDKAGIKSATGSDVRGDGKGDGPGRRIELDGKEILVWDGKNSPLYASQQGKRVSRFLDGDKATQGSKGRPFQTGKGKFGDPITILDPKERVRVDRVIKETDRIFFGDKSPKAKGKSAGEPGAADKGEIRKGEIRKGEIRGEPNSTAVSKSGRFEGGSKGQVDSRKGDAASGGKGRGARAEGGAGAGLTDYASFPGLKLPEFKVKWPIGKGKGDGAGAEGAKVKGGEAKGVRGEGSRGDAVRSGDRRVGATKAGDAKVSDSKVVDGKNGKASGTESTRSLESNARSISKSFSTLLPESKVTLVRGLQKGKAAGVESGVATDRVDHRVGDRRTGGYRTGDLGAGDRRTGDYRTVDHRAGDRRTGDFRAGDLRTADRKSVDLSPTEVRSANTKLPPGSTAGADARVIPASVLVQPVDWGALKAWFDVNGVLRTGKSLVGTNVSVGDGRRGGARRGTGMIAALAGDTATVKTDSGVKTGTVRSDSGVRTGTVRTEGGVKTGTVRTDGGVNTETVRTDVGAKVGGVKADAGTKTVSVRADAGSGVGLDSRLVDSKASPNAGGVGDSRASASSPGSKAGQDSAGAERKASGRIESASGSLKESKDAYEGKLPSIKMTYKGDAAAGSKLTSDMTMTTRSSEPGKIMLDGGNVNPIKTPKGGLASSDTGVGRNQVERRSGQTPLDADLLTGKVTRGEADSARARVDVERVKLTPEQREARTILRELYQKGYLKVSSLRGVDRMLDGARVVDGAHLIPIYLGMNQAKGASIRDVLAGLRSATPRRSFTPEITESGTYKIARSNSSQQMLAFGSSARHTAISFQADKSEDAIKAFGAVVSADSLERAGGELSSEKQTARGAGDSQTSNWLSESYSRTGQSGSGGGSASDEARKWYIVKEGETAEFIAVAQLSDESLASLIYEINKPLFKQVYDVYRQEHVNVLPAGTMILLPNDSDIKAFKGG